MNLKFKVSENEFLLGKKEFISLNKIKRILTSSIPALIIVFIFDKSFNPNIYTFLILYILSFIITYQIRLKRRVKRFETTAPIDKELILDINNSKIQIKSDNINSEDEIKRYLLWQTDNFIFLYNFRKKYILIPISKFSSKEHLNLFTFSFRKQKDKVFINIVILLNILLLLYKVLIININTDSEIKNTNWIVQEIINKDSAIEITDTIEIKFVKKVNVPNIINLAQSDSIDLSNDDWISKYYPSVIQIKYRHELFSKINILSYSYDDESKVKLLGLDKTSSFKLTKLNGKMILTGRKKTINLIAK